jgi:thioredoxin-like negative regulator of GroEL
VIERLLEAERDLSVGLVDRAEAIYRALADADPRNAVAVVGLARCALERGDERGAYDLAVRALSIDPDEAAALRMEARLSEVLATRGKPVERPAFVREPADGGIDVGAGGRSEPHVDGTGAATADEPQGARRGLLRRMLGRR